MPCENCLMSFANNKGEDQSFVRCLNSRIPTYAKTRISMPQLVHVADEAGLNLTWPEVPKIQFRKYICFSRVLKQLFAYWVFGNFACVFCCLIFLIQFKNQHKKIQKHYQCETIWIQSRPDEFETN